MTADRRAGARVDALADRFDALSAFVAAVWEHVGPATVAGDGGGGAASSGAVAAAGELSDRAIARLRRCGEHTVVALAGATGGGKSSLFNALARMELSATGELRPVTTQPHACVWGPDDADDLLDWLGIGQRFARESALDGPDEAPLHGLVLLDLPDMDSVAAGHRLEADRLLAVVDLVIWVLDPQKYADQSVHHEYLSRLATPTVVAFNQIDRLNATDADRCLADLVRLLEQDGLPAVPVIATSAGTGAGVDELRSVLEKTVASGQAARLRLEAELDQAVDALIPLVRPDLVTADGMADKEIATLVDEFESATGGPALAAAAGRAYARRAALPGWRAGAGSDAPPAVPPADPVAVGTALRRLAARCAAGLPPPWPDRAAAAAMAGVAQVPAALGEALHRARPRPPRASGWIAARTLFWLALAAGITGAAWLGLHRWRPAVPLPTVPLAAVRLPDGLPSGVSSVPVAVVLLGAGSVLALLVVLVGRPLARRRARRWQAKVQRQLRAAATDVARDRVEPVRTVLRDYAAARAALQAAARHPAG